MSFPKPPPPTDEQLAVLIATERIRVVRACPGAGKTEMFVEAIRRKLNGWSSPNAGVAALSFTNVARQAIESRVGSVVSLPHYTGTLDAFAFRFVVKPFAHLMGLPAGAVRLFPAPVCNHLHEPTVQIGKHAKVRATLFRTHFSGRNGNEPTMRAEMQVGATYLPVSVPQGLVQEIWTAKREFWAKTGIVTHSDCHFLASSILKHPDHGESVRDLVARRFPMLFIDELQDTGFYLARSFIRLCQHPKVSALVVGDPNQAIYGFGGASPTIFADFDALAGSKPFSLTRSQRCPKKIAQVASALTFDNTVVKPKIDAVDGALAIVVHHLDKPKLLPLQSKFLRELVHGASLAVIARKGKTAAGLRAEALRDDFCGKSTAARQISQAVERMLNRQPQEAAQIVDRELCRVVFDDAHAGTRELNERGITRAQWRSATFKLLLKAMAKIDGESWNDWVQRLKASVRDTALSLGLKPEEISGLKRYMVCKTKGITLRSQLLDVPLEQLWGMTDTITTVHKVKGAEFETVVIFAPKPSKGDPCPSVEWWKPDGDGEERRVAFVAVSRAKQKLVLCVHTTTYDALKAAHPQFVESFGEPIPLPMGA